METARKIYKNTSYLGLSEIVSKVLQFVIMLYAARLLSQDDFGKFNFALSLAMIAMVFADFGVNTFLIRDIARDKKNFSSILGSAAGLKLITSILTFLLFFVVISSFGYPAETIKIVIALLIFAIISSFTDMFYSLFRAFEVMQYDATIKTIRMILLTALAMFVLFQNKGVVLFSYIFAIVELIVLIMAYFISARFPKFGLRLDKKLVSKIFKESYAFGLSAGFGMLYFYIAGAILFKIKGDSETAIFSAAYNLGIAILLIPNVYTNAIYPVLSRYFSTSKTRLKTLYERSFKYLYLVGIPISVGIYALSDKIILMLYGEEYRGAIIILKIISWYIFLKFLNFLLGIILSSINEQRKRMFAQGVTAFFNIILCLVLIPIYGMIGAAIAILITEIFLFFVYYYFVSKSWYYYNFLKIMLRPIIAAVLLFIVAIVTKTNPIVSIFASAATYMLTIFILKTLDDKDYEILKSIMK